MNLAVFILKLQNHGKQTHPYAGVALGRLKTHLCLSTSRNRTTDATFSKPPLRTLLIVSRYLNSHICVTRDHYWSALYTITGIAFTATLPRSVYGVLQRCQSLMAFFFF